MTQPEFSFRAPVACDESAAMLRGWLTVNGWQTREELARGLVWSERKIRDVAESMGADIVRGQRGFKLTAELQRDELGDAAQAADAALSQGKRMIRYGLALKRKLHSKLS